MTQSHSPFAHGAVHRAAQRAGWLAELAAALDQASKLTIALFAHDGATSDASMVRSQIRALRTEVDSMQGRRQPEVDKFHPDWMHFIRPDQTPGDKSPPPPKSAR